MLFNPDDNQRENKLFGADDNNNNLDDSPAAEANENSLFSASMNSNSSDANESTALFSSSHISNDDDNSLDNSFVVSFKANESNDIVNEKLKSASENGGVDTSSLNMDSIDDFEFDSNVSAFKPFVAPTTSEDATTSNISSEQVKETMKQVVPTYKEPEEVNSKVK